VKANKKYSAPNHAFGAVFLCPQLAIVLQRGTIFEKNSVMKPLIDSLKTRIKAALARFAERKARQQAEGMQDEARSIVSNSLDFARREPLRAAGVALFAVGLGWLALRQRSNQKSIEGPIYN
jgi:ElaB/YqjD/DUF883 family membrane-anchored ribosome-binding protein